MSRLAFALRVFIASLVLAVVSAFALAQDSTLEVRRIFPGDTYRPAWEYAKLCSGIKPEKGHDYKNIIWYSARHGSMPDDIIGMWMPGDTIIIDVAYLHAPWVVAHELLHQLLQPIEDDDKHPANPFLHPCMLSTPQNVPAVDWILKDEVFAPTPEPPDGTVRWPFRP